jgi:hypothetical protein
VVLAGLGGKAPRAPAVAFEDGRSAPTLHLHEHKSSHNLHLQYSTKSQSTPHCQSLITPGSDHPLVLRRSGPQPVGEPIPTRDRKGARKGTHVREMEGGRREGGARSPPGHRTHAGEAAPDADARSPLCPRKERNKKS